jgi:transmembrane sensor
MDEDQLKDRLDAAKSMGESALDRALPDHEDGGDHAVLQQWLTEHPDSREVYEQLHDPAQLRAMLAASRTLGEHMPEELQRLYAKINPVPKLQPAKRTIRKSIYYIAGTAAAALIAVSTLLLLINHTSKTNEEQLRAAAVTNEIAPGGSKATITLSNGQIITLDSAGSGLLARQGQVQVQLAKGQVDYQAEKSSAAEGAYNTMTTPRGGTFRLTLADGTRIWLNAGSSIHYPVSFSGLKTREVEISGEAYVEVASNKSVPFIVKAGSEEIKVLGTHFNVMAYPDERQLQTTLLEGAVAVSQGEATKVLRPGQQARVSPEGVLSVADVDADDYVAWKNGLIQLHHADIPAIMRQISRWYDVKVVYHGTNFPSWTMAGTIPRTLNLSQALKVLELNGIHCKLEERTITVIL